jgi:hypothetical protein
MSAPRRSANLRQPSIDGTLIAALQRDSSVESLAHIVMNLSMQGNCHEALMACRSPAATAFIIGCTAKFSIHELREICRTPNSGLKDLESEILNGVREIFSQWTDHATKYIGGVYKQDTGTYTSEFVEGFGPMFAFVNNLQSVTARFRGAFGSIQTRPPNPLWEYCASLRTSEWQNNTVSPELVDAILKELIESGRLAAGTRGLMYKNASWSEAMLIFMVENSIETVEECIETWRTRSLSVKTSYLRQAEEVKGGRDFLRLEGPEFNGLLPRFNTAASRMSR